MNYTRLFECICAISEEELYRAPLPDKGESVGLSSAQFTQGQVPCRGALTGSLVKDMENKVTVFSAILKNFSQGLNLRYCIKFEQKKLLGKRCQRAQESLRKDCGCRPPAGCAVIAPFCLKNTHAYLQIPIPIVHSHFHSGRYLMTLSVMQEW